MTDGFCALTVRGTYQTGARGPVARACGAPGRIGVPMKRHARLRDLKSSATRTGVRRDSRNMKRWSRSSKRSMPHVEPSASARPPARSSSCRATIGSSTPASNTATTCSGSYASRANPALLVPRVRHQGPRPNRRHRLRGSVRRSSPTRATRRCSVRSQISESWRTSAPSASRASVPSR